MRMWHLRCMHWVLAILCFQQVLGNGNTNNTAKPATNVATKPAMNNATNPTANKATKPVIKPTIISSSSPPLLTSDGQLQLFPYNPDTKSAKAELITLMGRSAIISVKKPKSILPVFPGGRVSDFLLPSQLIIVPYSARISTSSAEESSTSSSQPPAPNGIFVHQHRHPHPHHARPPKPSLPVRPGGPPPLPSRPGGPPPLPSRPGGPLPILQPKSLEISIPPAPGMSAPSITSHMEEELNFLKITNTQLQCYISPPTTYKLDMEDLMGLWYLVRKVNDTERGTDQKYICEEVMYTQKGLTNTFIKVADVHFKHKWMTIHGNGTFIPPGILVIDWKVLSAPTVSDRLVFTIIGADPKSWVVGYMCKNGNPRPQLVLQTRKKDITRTELEPAYTVMHAHNLHLDNMVCQAGF